MPAAASGATAGYFRLCYSAAVGKRSIVMSVSVCLCVCLSDGDHIFGTTCPIFSKFIVRITFGLRSFWRLFAH